MSHKLRVENLNYKDVLNDINFEIPEGKIVFLTGKKGTTTLLKCLSNLINYNGKISVDSYEITPDSNIKFGVYLGVEYLEKNDVFSNLIEPLNNLNYDESKSRQKVYEISKKLGIDNILFKKMEELSHSQKKMVAFAQCIIHEPEIILLDQLFESLDKNYKSKVISYLKQFVKNKKNIVIFTSNNSDDMLLAHNILALNNGNLTIEGNIKELIKKDMLCTNKDITLPFLLDLSEKLKFYDLVDKAFFDMDEMVDEIWE